jgi:hypothetical protein
MAEHETAGGAPLQGVIFRDASTNDVEQVSALHADSWRRHYRGAYLDSFLDGDVVANRRAVWAERLAAPSANHFTIVAEHDGMLVGFVHMTLDKDPRWGALLDNLHVTHRLKRCGIGRGLLGEAAHGLIRRRPDARQFHLWVLDQNTAAQSFYVACGGTKVETTLCGPFPGGGNALAQRMAWPDAAALLSLLERDGYIIQYIQATPD